MTNDPRKFKRKQERHYSAHHTLLHVANLHLAKAELREPGWFYDAMITITFAALAIEAMTNAIGDCIVSDWKDFESLSPSAKARLLAENLKLEYSGTSEPWRSIKWLGKFRNQIAHPKPEHVVHEQLITDAECDNIPFEPPKSKLEREVTLGNAKRGLKAATDLKILLCEKIPAEDKFGLVVGGWLTSTELHSGSG
jgi:hypothetical protein